VLGLAFVALTASAVLATVATARSESLLARGVPAAEAVATGRDLALVVAAVALLLGAALAWLLPAHAGRSTGAATMAR
jgi:hypothetical protein